MSTSPSHSSGVRPFAEGSASADPAEPSRTSPDSGVRHRAVRVRFEGNGEGPVAIHIDGPLESRLHGRLRDALRERGLEITHLRLFVDGGRSRHTMWVSEADGSQITRVRRDEVQAVVLESVSAHVGGLVQRRGAH